MKYLILLSFVILSSCGQNFYERIDASSAQIGSTLKLSSTINASDESNARQICSAYRSKRLKIITSESLATASFDLTTNTCDGEQMLSVANVKILPNVTYSNQSVSLPYENYIQTDERGPLQSICNSIYQNSSISVIDYTDELNVKQVVFVNEYSFYILYGSKKSKSDLDYKLIQKLEYVIGNDSSKLTYGHILKYKETNSCANTTSSFTREQLLK